MSEESVLGVGKVREKMWKEVGYGRCGGVKKCGKGVRKCMG